MPPCPNKMNEVQLDGFKLTKQLQDEWHLEEREYTSRQEPGNERCSCQRYMASNPRLRRRGSLLSEESRLRSFMIERFLFQSYTYQCSSC